MRADLRRLAPALVVFAVLAGACGSDGDSNESKGETTPAALVDMEGPFAPTGDEVGVVDGAGALYSGTVPAVPDGTGIVAIDGPEDVAGVLGVGMGVHVEVPGTFTGAFELHLAVPGPPTDTAIPGVLHRRDDGTYAIEPALWNPDSGTVIASADEFSDRWGVWYDPRNWVEEVVDLGKAGAGGAITVVGGTIDFVSDFVTGRTDPPPCRNDSPSWASTTVSEAASLHLCAQANEGVGRIRAEVFLKSNRRTAQVVNVPSLPKDYLWVEEQDFEPYRRLLARGAGVDAATNVVLLGEHEMSMGFPQPAFSVTFESRAYQTVPIIVLNPILAALGNLPVQGVAAMAMASFKCVQEISGFDVTQFDVIPDDLGTLPEALGKAVRCAFEVLQNPELVVGLAREALDAIGISGSQASGVLSEVGTHARRIAPTAVRFFAALSAGSVLTNTWDGFFDNAAEGLITTSLTGAVSDDRLLTIAGCEGPCRVSGRVSIDHPRWGTTHLITIGPVDEFGSTCATRMMFAVDDAGELVWDSGATLDGCPWSGMAPAGKGDYGSDVSRPVDASGRIFFDWNPGRYNGVAVLTVTEDGFDDHGTLPAPGYSAARFYYAEVFDDDSDGVYEIRQFINSCTPTCAGAYTASTLYRWSGSDFVGVVPTTETQCGDTYLGNAVYFGDYASDIAAGVTDTGITCVEAIFGDGRSDSDSISLVERISASHTPYEGDATFSAEGFNCTVTAVEGGPYEFYRCTDGDRSLEFDRYVE